MERRPSSGRRLPPEPPLSPRTPSVQQTSVPRPFGALTSPPMTHQLSTPNLMPKSPSRNTLQQSLKLPPTPSEPQPQRLVPDPIIVPNTNGMPRSAPQSPRSPKNDPSQGPSPQRQRKFSDVRDLDRNGSMASVLERQHILQKEFNSIQDSALVQSASDHSSIFPSTEQVSL